MPHISRFLGVNSVTNIEPDKGDLPAAIIRIVGFFANYSYLHLSECRFNIGRGVRQCIAGLS